MPTPLPEFVSAEELAGLVGVSPHSIWNYVRRGVLPRVTDNRYPLGDSIRRLADFYSKPEASPKGRDALLVEQYRRLRLANDETESNLVPRDTLDGLGALWMGAVEGECASFAKRATRNREVKARLQREIAASLSRINAAVARATAELSGGDEGDEAEAA